MAPQRAKIACADVGDSVFVLLQGPLAPLNGFAANRGMRIQIHMLAEPIEDPISVVVNSFCLDFGHFRVLVNSLFGS